MRGLACIAAVAAAFVAATAGTAAAAATTVTYVQNVSVENITKSPCFAGGKLGSFLVEGTLHQNLTIVVDGTGAQHLVNHVAYHFTGTSPTGVTYVASSQYIVEINGGGALENTWIQTIRWVALGETTPADDYQSMLLYHVTTTPDGTVTSSFYTFDADCR